MHVPEASRSKRFCPGRQPVSWGGIYLSGLEDAFVMDIGGQLQISQMSFGGKLAVRDEGAKVGKMVYARQGGRSITAGLGGDSRICMDGNKKIQIGPEKSIPYCMASEKYPELRVNWAKSMSAMPIVIFVITMRRHMY